MADLDLVVRLLTLTVVILGICVPGMYCLGYWAGRRDEGIAMERLVELTHPYPGAQPAGINHTQGHIST